MTDGRVTRWWFPAVPAERLAAFRILVGGFAVGYLLARLPVFWADAHGPRAEWEPHGVVDLVLAQPLPAPAVYALLLATIALAAAFAVGWRHAVVAPVFGVALLWVLTYRSSWGMLYHTENLLVLHALVVAFAPAADAWSLDARRRGGAPPPPDGRYGWALRACAAVTVITYVLAGVAKLRIAGWDWIDGAQLRDQIAYDNLRTAVYGATPSWLATPLLAHPWFFTGLAALTMIVELGAPVALLHPRVAAAWALAAWGFHVGVLALMHIVFIYPLLGLAYAPLLPVERPLRWLGQRLTRQRIR